MSQVPAWKIYSPTGEYLGCMKHAEDAAAVVAIYGDGATVRAGHKKWCTVWTEGADGEAAESYDLAAERMLENMRRLDSEAVQRDPEKGALLAIMGAEI